MKTKYFLSGIVSLLFMMSAAMATTHSFKTDNSHFNGETQAKPVIEKPLFTPLEKIFSKQNQQSLLFTIGPDVTYNVGWTDFPSCGGNCACRKHKCQLYGGGQACQYIC